jgi:hypothetical protein
MRLLRLLRLLRFLGYEVIRGFKVIRVIGGWGIRGALLLLFVKVE